MAAQVDRDQAEVAGERALGAEKAAIGHQAVKQQQRPALAFLFIGDARAVGCRELLQNILPAARSCSESVPSPALALR